MRSLFLGIALCFGLVATAFADTAVEIAKNLAWQEHNYGFKTMSLSVKDELAFVDRLKKNRDLASAFYRTQNANVLIIVCDECAYRNVSSGIVQIETALTDKEIINFLLFDTYTP